MTQGQLLTQAFFMLVKGKVCSEKPIKDWIKVLLFLHKKGYLYASCEGEKLVMIACMYRIPELNKKTENRYPEKEEGKILYIPFFVSTSKDKNLARTLFKQFLSKNSDIEEIVAFQERDGKTKLRSFKRRKQEQKNGKR